MKPPKGVLLLAHSLDLGGTERQMTEIAKGLDPRKFTAHIASFHPHGIRADELRAQGIPVLHLPVTSFASLSAIKGGVKLIRYIRKHQIRLIHAFDVPLNIFAVPFARLAHAPIVLSSQRAHRNLTPGIYTQLLRITDQMVDGIVVNCLHMRDHLIKDERVPTNFVHLCYNGIDLDLFNRDRAPAIPREAAITIGVVCALRPEKGLATLLDAFAKLTHPQVRLLIVGSGPMLEQLEQQAAALGVRGRCTFQPKTPDVAPWMRAIDIFVLPSLSEALSNSLMEAMACGCCCVASNVGGNPELLGSDESRGLLFPKGDSAALAGALERLIRDHQLRSRLADAGFDFIHSGFGQSHSIARMSEIYNSFLD